MLLELRIHNLAIVADLQVRPGPGLTVLTGETGAGKSVIARSLSLLAGARVPAGLVREGEELGFAEGVFDLSDSPDLRARLGRMGVGVEGDGILVLRREIRPNGRDRVLCNGMVSSLALLKEIGKILLAIQSQDQQRELSRPGFARDLLDRWAGTAPLVQAVVNCREQVHEAEQALDRIRLEVEQGREQEELWRYQLDEIESARLDPREEELLAEQLLFGRNARQLLEAADKARVMLEDGEPSARALLASSRSVLEQVGSKSERIRAILECLAEAEDSLGQAGRHLASYLDSCEVDPARLDELEERKALYEELQRKYHRNVEGLLGRASELRQRLDLQDDAAGRVQACEQSLTLAQKALADAATALHDRRSEAAPALADRLEHIIRPLGLPDLECRVVVEVAANSDSAIRIGDTPCSVAAHGADVVSLCVRPNPGEKFGAVEGIASGGERSRIFLGISLLDAVAGEGPVRLFDEIDAGLGMEGAAPVAELLARLATGGQVLCISHLASVAARGSRHIKISKTALAGRTRVEAVMLEDQARVEELARLLGGEAVVSDRRDQEAFARRLFEEGQAAG